MPSADAIGLFLVAVRKGSGVWGRFDHGRPGVGVTEWAIIIGATVLLVVVMCISTWRAKRHKAQFLHNSKSRMFSELAAAHRLDRANRRLLKQLAAANGVVDASTLFVAPEFFETAKVPPALKGSADEIRRLRHELFEE
jgi:hypothetical protein